MIFAGKILSHPTHVLFHFLHYVTGDWCQNIPPAPLQLLFSGSVLDCRALLEDFSSELRGNSKHPATVMSDFSQPANSPEPRSSSASPRYEREIYGRRSRSLEIHPRLFFCLFLNMCLSYKPRSHIYWSMAVVGLDKRRLYHSWESEETYKVFFSLPFLLKSSGMKEVLIHRL